MLNLVLLGAGHANLIVLRSLWRRPIRSISVTLVEPRATVPYSGALPGYISGIVPEDDLTIDVAAVAKRAGAQHRLAAVTLVDGANRQVTLSDGHVLTYDVAFLNTGAHPASSTIGGAQRALGIKPIGAFLDHIATFSRSGGEPGAERPIAVIGGGVAGAELSLALAARLGRSGAVVLFSGGDLARSLAKRPRALLRNTLDRAGVRIIDATVTAMTPDRVMTNREAVEIQPPALLATGVEPPPWLGGSPHLPRGRSGFVRVNRDLTVPDCPGLLAAGDCVDHPDDLPRSGAVAVRQGEHLARALRRTRNGLDSRDFPARRHYLAIIGCGDARAIAVYGPLAVRSRLAWRLKRWLDLRFVRSFQRGA